MAARVGMTSAALTSSTFEGFIKGADKVLVDFYDRTCVTFSQTHIALVERRSQSFSDLFQES